jgi:hypothetical protein
MASEQKAIYRFDRFTLDLLRGALLSEGGSELKLRPKSFECCGIWWCMLGG